MDWWLETSGLCPGEFGKHWRMNLRGCSQVHTSPGLSSPVCSGSARAPHLPACLRWSRVLMHQQPWAGLQGQVISLSQTSPGTCCLQLVLPVGNITKHAAHWHPRCMGRQRGHQGACHIHAVTVCLTRVLTSLLSSPEQGSQPGCDS